MKKLSFIFAGTLALTFSIHGNSIAAGVCVLILETRKREALKQAAQETDQSEQEKKPSSNLSTEIQKDKPEENEISFPLSLFPHLL